jgi:hypothetical protein
MYLLNPYIFTRQEMHPRTKEFLFRFKDPLLALFYQSEIYPNRHNFCLEGARRGFIPILTISAAYGSLIGFILCLSWKDLEYYK